MSEAPAGLTLLVGKSHSAMEVAIQSFHELAEAILAGDLSRTQAAAERMQRQTLDASDYAASIMRLAQGMRTTVRRVG